MKTKTIQFEAMANAAPGNGGKPWFEFKANAAADEVEVTIYDQIGKDWWTGDGIESKRFVEALNKVPRTTNITLRVNSPGGNVHDGMVIYNRLAERRDRVTCYVDGLAASIASVIILAAKRVVIPANALIMVHDPWTVCQGTSEEMRKTAETLDKHRDAIAAVYEGKIKGKSRAEIEKWMKDTTWFLGQEAVDAGFADEVSQELAFTACFDLAKFANVPKRLQEQQNKQENKGNMNREAMIAKLKKLGVQFEDTASDEELKALLQSAEAKAKQASDAAAKKKKAADADPDAALEEEGELESEEDAQPPSRTPQAKAKAKRTVVVVDDSGKIATMQAQLDAITAQRNTERKARIESAVDACVAQDRIPATQRDKWVARAMADEAILDDLRQMEPRPPGADPAALLITAEAPKDIERGLLKLRAPLQSWIKGNHVGTDVISANAKAMAIGIEANRKRLAPMMNTNTVDTDLKRNVILSDIMRAFKRRIVQLGVFATTYTNVPLQGTNKVLIPYFELDDSASKDFLNSTGYIFDEDTSATSRDITVNKRKYKSMQFSSDEFRRQPYFNPPMSLMLKAEQLALDVWNDVLTVITQATYGNPVLAREPATWDVDDVITVRKAAQNAEWPEMGRSLVLGTDHEAALLADESLKHFMNSNDTAPLRAGSTGRLLGFDMFYSPRIPTNGEDLAGFAVLPNAVLVATAPIAPAPGVRTQLLAYDLVVDPDTGVAFEYRYWGEAQADKDREIVEVNYGYKRGNSDALLRITAGASEFSSSSSESSSSSVNSSSSSSSQS